MRIKETKPSLNISFRIGERQNVALTGDPMVRRIINTEWKRDNRGLWFYWFWEPEHTGERNFDCGFSGILILNRSGSVCESNNQYVTDL